MDPDQALEALRRAIRQRDHVGAAEAADALDTWLSMGGYLPADWDVARETSRSVP